MRVNPICCSLPINPSNWFCRSIFHYRSSKTIAKLTITLWHSQKLSFLANQYPTFLTKIRTFPRQNLAHILYKNTVTRQHYDFLLSNTKPNQAQNPAVRRQGTGGVSQPRSRLRQLAYRSERVLYQPSQCDLFSLCDRRLDVGGWHHGGLYARCRSQHQPSPWRYRYSQHSRRVHR